MVTTVTKLTRNEVVALLLNHIVPNKCGHLLLDHCQQDVLWQLQKAGYLDQLHVEGRVVDVSYNSTLIGFYNNGGFPT